MTNKDQETKEKFYAFVNDWKSYGEIIDKIKPLIERYENAIGEETSLITTVERNTKFLEIDKEFYTAPDSKKLSDGFKSALYDSKVGLSNISKVLNDCKNTLNQLGASADSIAPGFKSNIDGHLTTIREALDKAKPYLVDFVPTETKVEESEKIDDPINELLLDDKQDNNDELTMDTKVVETEPQIEAVSLDAQTDSLEELSSAVDKEMDINHTNIGELMAANDSYKQTDEVNQDNSVPFNFDQMNLSTSNELTDSSELSAPVVSEEPIDTIKPTDDEMDISQWFENNNNSAKLDNENTKSDELTGSIDEVLNEENHSDNIDEAEQKVVNIESMFDTTKDKENSDDYTLSLEKAS